MGYNLKGWKQNNVVVLGFNWLGMSKEYLTSKIAIKPICDWCSDENTRSSRSSRPTIHVESYTHKKKKTSHSHHITIQVIFFLKCAKGAKQKTRNALATRSGTAATRPRVRIVGRVSNLEDSGSGSGLDWAWSWGWGWGWGCGDGTGEPKSVTRPALPKHGNLCERENPRIWFLEGEREGMYLRRCWVGVVLVLGVHERGLVLVAVRM